MVIGGKLTKGKPSYHGASKCLIQQCAPKLEHDGFDYL